MPALHQEELSKKTTCHFLPCRANRTCHIENAKEYFLVGKWDIDFANGLLGDRV